jgi:hypothetical protein
MNENPLGTGTRNPPILGGGKRRNRDTRKDQRRTNALHRAEARAARTDAEQLRVLHDNGHGHCDEASHLAATIKRSELAGR